VPNLRKKVVLSMLYPNIPQTSPSNVFRCPNSRSDPRRSAPLSDSALRCSALRCSTPFGCSEPSEYALRCSEAGKKFEKKMEDAFFEDTGHRLERLTDLKLNSQPCDYFAILSGINLFLEVKWTSKAELPLSNVAEHQMTSMRDFDGHIPSCHAGFLIGLGERRDRQLWYLSGTALWQFVQNRASTETIKSAYLRANGISIRYTYDHQKKELHVFFREFLEVLRTQRKLW